MFLFFHEGDRKSDPYEENHRENPKVVNMINGFIHWLVQEFSVDGLRVDTVKHVRKSFWPGFEAAAGVFCTGEVLHGGERVCSFHRYVTLFELLILTWCKNKKYRPGLHASISRIRSQLCAQLSDILSFEVRRLVQTGVTLIRCC